MILIRLLLLPFSILYGLIMQLRNLFYDLAVFKIYRFDKTVISIGNLTAGGTGKTPLTVYLANVLINQGRKVALVSRGYGRKSKGFQLVSDSINSYGNSLINGDEPVLISLLAPRAIVAVCENRSLAISQLNSRYSIDIFILDDAFQHRAVHRNIDIVLLSDWNSVKNKLILPSGLLREFRFNLKRADIIINRDAHAIHQDHYNCKFQIKGLYDLNFNKQGSIEILSTKNCVAFAGIAQPESFRKSLRTENIHLPAFIAYKDHYHYTSKDMQFLIHQCQEHKCKILLCTQKDMVKIRELDGIKNLLENKGIDLFAPALKITLNNEQSFLKKIESHLD